jgi:hypothetical protein
MVYTFYTLYILNDVSVVRHERDIRVLLFRSFYHTQIAINNPLYTK